MKSLFNLFIKKERAFLMLSLLAVGLVFFRIFYLMEGSCTQWGSLRTCPRLRFLFLGWNLLLAWVPVGLIYLLPRVQPNRFLLGLLLLVWLLFFPNAPYLMTDLVHLRARPGVPLWYDALLLFHFAYLGLWLGIRALEGVRAYLRQQHGRWWANVFTTLALALSGLGIYLGRVLRWNSWDAVFRPQGPVLDTLALFLAPEKHLEAWLMIVVFTLVFSGIYWSQGERLRGVD